jgi:hypothetical protein
LEALTAQSVFTTREFYYYIPLYLFLVIYRRPFSAANDSVTSQELLWAPGGKRGWAAVATLCMRECCICFHTHCLIKSTDPLLVAFQEVKMEHIPWHSAEGTTTMSILAMHCEFRSKDLSPTGLLTVRSTYTGSGMCGETLVGAKRT